MLSSHSALSAIAGCRRASAEAKVPVAERHPGRTPQRERITGASGIGTCGTDRGAGFVPVERWTNGQIGQECSY